MVISLVERIIKYVNRSPENRTQLMLVLAFFIIPVIGLTVLFIIMRIYFH